MKQAPLFVRCYDFYSWLSDRCSPHLKPSAYPKLAEKLMDHAGVALDGISLALKGLDRLENLDRADAALVLLRVYLRLAAEKQLLTSRQLAYGVGEIDEIGRQLGGWLKSLEGL